MPCIYSQHAFVQSGTDPTWFSFGFARKTSALSARHGWQTFEPDHNSTCFQDTTSEETSPIRHGTLWPFFFFLFPTTYARIPSSISTCWRPSKVSLLMVLSVTHYIEAATIMDSPACLNARPLVVYGQPSHLIGLRYPLWTNHVSVGVVTNVT